VAHRTALRFGMLTVHPGDPGARACGLRARPGESIGWPPSEPLTEREGSIGAVYVSACRPGLGASRAGDAAWP